MSVRLSDIRVGGTYICGPKDIIEQGLCGIPVVVVAIGKFTTVMQPCGQAIVPFEGDKRRELVVAVRECDAQFLTNSRSRFGYGTRAPVYVPPSGKYPQPNSRSPYEGDITLRRVVLRETVWQVQASLQGWIPKIIPNSWIRMTEEEFRIKNDAARELADAVRVSHERERRAHRKYTDSRVDLVRRVVPNSGARVSPGYHNQTVDDTVVLKMEDFVKLVEKAKVRGTKTAIRTMQNDLATWKDAKQQLERSTTCARDAGL